MRQRQVIPGSESGHMPDSLVYGPVVSRRFGRSLGVSFSQPGHIGCRWTCPYCQLGGGSNRVGDDVMSDPKQVIQGLREGLHRHAHTIDVVTIAGSGEPLDHPLAALLLRACRNVCAEYKVPMAVLTNGDGIADFSIRNELQQMDHVFMKWDPGPLGGSWGVHSSEELQRRIRLMTDWVNLCLQTTIFEMADGGRGNNSYLLRRNYLEELAE